jgi:hypothetical protein
MLYINGLLSYQITSGDVKYEPVIKDQIGLITNEISSSKYGIIYDYPGEAYPIDLIPLLYAVQKSDKVFGTDHSNFISSAYRIYEGDFIDKNSGLPSYIADIENGKGIGSARGIEVSLFLIWSHELWPDKTAQVFQKYDELFIEQSNLLTGVREFPSSYGDLGFLNYEVDAGPIILNYGSSSSTFGIAANQANGYFDYAYDLKTEAIAAGFPLISNEFGTLSWMSGQSDAPLGAESVMLFNFSQISQTEEMQTELSLPLIVVIGIVLEFGLAIFLILRNSLSVYKFSKEYLLPKLIYFARSNKILP